MLLNPFRFGVPIQYDPDAIALFERMSGVEPSNALKGRINDFIVTGKEQNILPILDCLYTPKGMQDQVAGTLDWKAVRSAVISGSASWDAANGFVAANTISSPQVQTNFLPDGSGNYKYNTCSVGIYLTSLTPMASNYSTLFAAYGSSSNRQVFCDIARYSNLGVLNSRLHGGFFDEDYVYRNIGTGLIIMSRVNVNTWTVHQNGILLGTITATAGGLPTESFLLLRGKYGDYASNLSIGAFFAGGYIDPAKHLTFKAMFDSLWT